MGKSLAERVNASDATRVGQATAQKAEQKAKEKRLAKKGKGVGYNGNPLKKITKNHVNFVGEYIKNGWNATAAYMHAFPDCSENTARNRGPALANDPLILEEIQRQWKPMLQDVDADIGYLSRKIYNYTRVNMADYFTQVTIEEPLKTEEGHVMYDDDGNPKIAEVKQRLVLKDLHELPLWMQENIKEIEVIPTEYGDHIKVKLVDSFKATMELAKHLGVFKSLDEDGDLNKLKDQLVQGALRAQEAARMRREGAFDGEFEEMKDVGPESQPALT